MAPEGPAILAKREQCRPPSPFEAGSDEAAGTPATSVSAVSVEKGALSSPEDDASIDKSLCGDGRIISVELPVDNSLPTWRKFAQRAKSSQD